MEKKYKIDKESNEYKIYELIKGMSGTEYAECILSTPSKEMIIPMLEEYEENPIFIGTLLELKNGSLV